MTTVLTSDWLSGAGGEGEHLLGAAHREEEGEAVRQRAAQVSELNVHDSLHNIVLCAFTEYCENFVK